VAAVKEMDYVKVSKTHGVPRGALERDLRQCVGEELIAVGRKIGFTVELETDLMNHCLQMEQYFGCSCSDRRH
jgi:hypothetical protein